MSTLPEYLAFLWERLDEADARDRAKGRLPARHTETVRQVIISLERELEWQRAYPDALSGLAHGLLRALQILGMAYHDHPGFDEMRIPPEWGHGWWPDTTQPVSSDPTS